MEFLVRLQPPPGVALALGLVLALGCSGQGSTQSGVDAQSEDAAELEPDATGWPEDPAGDAEPPDAERDAEIAPDPDAGAESDAGDAADAMGDAGPEAGPSPAPLSALIEAGEAYVHRAPRPAYGALLAAHAGARSYVVESRRDAEPGPLGIPWRSRFRVAAYDGTKEAWAFVAEPDDVIGDVVVHPSGEVTLSLERFAPAREAFELVRLRADGEVLARAPLPIPARIPEGDYGASDPRPLFRMKSPFADATAAGWMRLIAEGEGLAVAFMSFVDVPAQDPRVMRRALGLARLDWRAHAYEERWTRVVEGAHGADPAAWAYDELRWREQAVRPFLARDHSRGELLVGRAWNQSRCHANRETFAEFGPEECVLGAVNALENERLPLAVTRFDADGERLGTRILRPDPSAAEQLPFALAARQGRLAVVGSLVRKLSEETRRTYPDANGYVDYDGYVSIYDAEGAPLIQHDFNLGRGDVLAALHWSERGLVAVGSSDWDRWQGGMSISRGASPLFVWLSADGREARQRVIPLGDASRHYNLHDVMVLEDAIIGVGFSDAPMTHSADGVGSVARTFGPLRVELRR